MGLIAPSQLPKAMSERLAKLEVEAEDKRERGIPLTDDEEMAIFEAKLWMACADVLASGAVK